MPADEATSLGTAALAVGITVWVCALFLGPFLTVLPPFADDGWWLWPLLRLSLGLAGVVVFVVGFAAWGPRESRTAGALGKALGISTGLTLLVNVNVVLDLIRGPYDATGTVQDIATWTGKVYTRPTAPAQDSAHGALVFRGADGDTVEIEPLGLQVGRMEDVVAACPSGQGRLRALRHLDVVLSLDCSASTAPTGGSRTRGR